MERVMSVEDRIKHAEEIYQRRKYNSERTIATVNLNKNKKEYKLLKKMMIQLLICAVIYFIISIIYNNNYVFSKDFINKTNEILSYDINILDYFEKVKWKVNEVTKNINKTQIQEDNNQTDTEDNKEESKNLAIGGADNSEEINNIPLTQEEQDIVDIKNTTSFIKPIEGIISSEYGIRENATGNIPKNHTGIDIAANIGTKIKSATNGEVILDSEQGDYGKHLKIKIGDVIIIYAHCNSLYVKKGDNVIQGQEIAEVGSTGNSTGPHLHFEIIIKDRTINPINVLEL